MYLATHVFCDKKIKSESGCNFYNDCYLLQLQICMTLLYSYTPDFGALK